MVNRSKIKGTRGESELVGYLRGFWPNAERRALAGGKDKGDVINTPVVWEMKNARRFQLSAWMDETEQERVNAGVDIGVLVIKRVQKNIDKAYAIVPLWQMAALLKERDEQRSRISMEGI